MQTELVSSGSSVSRTDSYNAAQPRGLLGQRLNALSVSISSPSLSLVSSSILSPLPSTPFNSSIFDDLFYTSDSQSVGRDPFGGYISDILHNRYSHYES